MSKTKKGDALSSVLPVIRRQKHRRIALILNSSARTGLCVLYKLLSGFLRRELDATGTHAGCEHGVHDACTIRMGGAASRSCLMLAMQADGRAVDTVEGPAMHGGLSDLQEAFHRHHALQCGSHTVGTLMSCADYLERMPEPTEAQAREMLSGHLCRYTGYALVVAAVLGVTASRAGVRPISVPVSEETNNV